MIGGFILFVVMASLHALVVTMQKMLRPRAFFSSEARATQTRDRRIERCIPSERYFWSGQSKAPRSY